ncbi:helix-turn-helix domain-containing protein [Sphaerimonospora cavernae]|uniref:Helix-turn-helix domain-containing protein n=1 Tax=Sphaerimonospora cavernae TaxID=1740611 RepID=A0ABV6UB50_9ACTN
MSEFDTEHLPARDRFPSWLEHGGNALTPSWVHTEQRETFRARTQAMELGGMQIATLAHPSVTVRRSAKLIRQRDPEAFQIHLVLQGEAGIRQAGRETVLTADNFTLIDTSRPFEGWRACTSGTTTAVVLQIPRKRLPLPSNIADHLAAVPFSCRRGLGGVFARWLVGLGQQAGELSAQDTDTVASVTVDLLSAVLPHRLTGNGGKPPESRKLLRQAQIRDYIRQRLGDPNLSPETIAAAHQISLRYLYKIFDGQGVTLSAWIRRSRLEQCRRFLADPRHHTRPVHAIAARWGFGDAAHFSRAFRAAYGESPIEYRTRILQSMSVS